MKRTTKVKVPDAILSADWHLRDTTPICRTDDFFGAMEDKVDFILGLQGQFENKPPILVAGDMLHSAISSPFLEAWAINRFLLAGMVLVTPGQHDLPNHNLALYHKSSLCVLEQAGAVMVGRHEAFDARFGRVNTFPYGEPIKPATGSDTYVGGKNLRVCLAHVLIRRGKTQWPGMEAERAHDLLDRLDYDLIVTGDNHRSFTVKRKGKLLVNPGSLMRTEADQDDYEPCVYLWYADTNEVEPVYLPIVKGVVTRDHIEREEAREARVAAFAERLPIEVVSNQLSFTNNLKAHMEKNKTIKPVRQLVWEAVKDEG